MKILFITPRLLYPTDRGDKIRPFNFARILSKKYNLHLVSFIQSRKETKYIDNLKEYFVSIDTVYFSRWKSFLNMGLNIFFFRPLPLQVYYFKSIAFKKKVKEALEKQKVDLAYIFHLRMAQYLVGKDEVYKVLDFTDAVSLFMKRLVSYSEWYMKPIFLYERSRLLKYEKRLMRYFDEHWVVSDIDKKALGNGDRHNNYSNLYVVPNGVDTDYFKNDFEKIKEKKDERIMLFVGYMGRESIDSVLYFYKKIYPLIRKIIPDVEFYIVGANPPNKIRALAKNSNVVVAGYVEDLREWYHKASILVAPMRFVAGMQNKILEAMAMELPVVTTSYGNEGIDAVNGKEIFVADTPEEFSQRAIDLLNDKKLRKKIGRAGREFVKNKYRWESVLERIDEIEKKVFDKNLFHKQMG
ncbi:MAG: glycosyltransferase [bacterium]